MDQPSRRHFAIDEQTFKVSRRGYRQAEVRAFLEEVERAFRELEIWAQETVEALQHAEGEVRKLRAARADAVDQAMIAVFDAKDRILERARSRAARIADEAAADAERIRLEAKQSGAPTGNETSPSPSPLRESVIELKAADSDQDSLVAAPLSYEGSTDIVDSARAEAQQILAEARREADRIKKEALLAHERAAGEPEGSEDDDQGDKQTRYNKQSAQLPRLGSASDDLLASIADIRRLRGKGEDAERE